MLRGILAEERLTCPQALEDIIAAFLIDRDYTCFSDAGLHGSFDSYTDELANILDVAMLMLE